MELIWHGTASIELVCDQGRILFDPFVPIAPSSVPVTLQEFDGFTDIFVTHGHFDHIASIPPIIQRNPNTRIYCTRTPFATLRKQGVPAANLTLIDYGQTINVNGFRVTAFHGKHAILPRFSPHQYVRILRNPARGNALALLRLNRQYPENDETVFYQVECGETTLALMGSLNLRNDVEYPTGADLLVLPYNGWDDNYPHAVHIIQALQPRRVVLHHFDDTFPPLTYPLDLDPILQYAPIAGIGISPLELHAPMTL